MSRYNREITRFAQEDPQTAKMLGVLPESKWGALSDEMRALRQQGLPLLCQLGLHTGQAQGALRVFDCKRCGYFFPQIRRRYRQAWAEVLRRQANGEPNASTDAFNRVLPGRQHEFFTLADIAPEPSGHVHGQG